MSIRHTDGLGQDRSNSSALAMELLQSCTKPSILPWPQSRCPFIIDKSFNSIEYKVPVDEICGFPIVKFNTIEMQLCLIEIIDNANLDIHLYLILFKCICI